MENNEKNLLLKFDSFIAIIHCSLVAFLNGPVGKVWVVGNVDFVFKSRDGLVDTICRS